MGVTAGTLPAAFGERGLAAAPTAESDLTDADRAALWLYAHFVGARHRPSVPPRRSRFGVVYDESGYPVGAEAR